MLKEVLDQKNINLSKNFFGVKLSEIILSVFVVNNLVETKDTVLGCITLTTSFYCRIVMNQRCMLG
jgi:hypothetical protein